MNQKKEIKKAIVLFAISIVLMFAAILTATSAFAMPKISDSSASWDIKFSSPKLKNKNSNATIKVTSDNIDFHVLLKSFSDSFSFIIDVTNEGDFDAYLARFSKTDLSNQKIGTSTKTGKTYYLNDYISYTVTYLENNKENKVIVNAPLNRNDKLLKNTENSIVVTVKYLDEKKLSEDQLAVLEENILKTNINGKYYLAFELDLNLNLVYQQLK